MRSAVAGYFRDPGIFEQEKSNGPMPGGEMRVDPEQASEEPSSEEVAEGSAAGAREDGPAHRELLASRPI